MIAIRLSDKELKALRPLFDQFDSDGSGSVDVSELTKIVTLMKLEMSPAEVKALVAEADEDGSGEISFDEVRARGAKARGAEAPIRTRSRRSYARPFSPCF